MNRLRYAALLLLLSCALAPSVRAAELPPAHRIGTLKAARPEVDRFTIRNLGTAAIPNPRLLPAADAPDSASIAAIVASVADPAGGDREKAETLWRFVMDRTRHICPAKTDGVWLSYAPLETLNTIGYGCCDQVASALATLWVAAGLKARISVLPFHTVPEVFYDERWHMYDPDHRVAYRLDDNHTVASVDDVLNDPSLVARVPDPQGYDAPWMAQKYFAHRAARAVQDAAPPSERPPFRLHPRSALTLDRNGDGIKPVPMAQSTVPYRPAKGTLVDRFRIPSEDARLRLRGAERRGAGITPRAADSRAYVHAEVSTPARIAGASVAFGSRLAGASRIVVRVAGEPDSIGAVVATRAAGETPGEIDLTNAVRSLAAERFWLVLELDARGAPETAALADELVVTTRFQVSPWSLPVFGKGPGAVWYRDDRGGAGSDVAVEIDGQALRYPGTSSAREAEVPRDPGPWEAADDAGVAEWRSYLADTAHRIEKRLALPASPPPEPCRLRIFLDGANTVGGKAHTYRVTAAIDGTALWRFTGVVPEEPGWHEIPIPAALLREKTEALVTLGVTGQPDIDWNYVSVYGGPPAGIGRSRFEGVPGADQDLSLDPGTQRGEFLIRIVCGEG